MSLSYLSCHDNLVYFVLSCLVLSNRVVSCPVMYWLSLVLSCLHIVSSRLYLVLSCHDLVLSCFYLALSSCRDLVFCLSNSLTTGKKNLVSPMAHIRGCVPKVSHLSCLVLSCLALSCLVLWFRVLSCLVLSCRVLSHLSYPVLSSLSLLLSCLSLVLPVATSRRVFR
jgi:hypothetical protein